MIWKKLKPKIATRTQSLLTSNRIKYYVHHQVSVFAGLNYTKKGSLNMSRASLKMIQRKVQRQALPQGKVHVSKFQY